MQIEIKYSGLEDRQRKVAKNEAKGLRMLTDNFDDPNWKTGDTIKGTMTFTDEPSPVVPIEPSEIELIKNELNDLKARIKKLEKQ